MPIYEFQCSDCKERLEAFFHSFNGSRKVPCPSCGKEKMERVPSLFGFRSGSVAVGPSGSSNCSTCSSKNCNTCN
ncbi:zinc ribbon domain-containing protein [candidate division NPL-UPA2 bacterium Unc8]|uniref:Zinc ribbon domain-containing protein n=1 Tax=candidate division NPL-UPA2 bacterium Unc8 TaxID=1980939 RepID=A0A399G0S3_UNCN2|nr:MAG: zinc ribbon domain-containing protein [candidate division NPL-UPA2 bacterium Unc8]